MIHPATTAGDLDWLADMRCKLAAAAGGGNRKAPHGSTGKVGVLPDLAQQSGPAESVNPFAVQIAREMHFAAERGVPEHRFPDWPLEGPPGADVPKKLGGQTPAAHHHARLIQRQLRCQNLLALQTDRAVVGLRVHHRQQVIGDAMVGGDVQGVGELDQQGFLAARHLRPDAKPLVKAAGKLQQGIIIGVVRERRTAAARGADVFKFPGQAFGSGALRRIADPRDLAGGNADEQQIHPSLSWWRRQENFAFAATRLLLVQLRLVKAPDLVADATIAFFTRSHARWASNCIAARPRVRRAFLAAFGHYSRSLGARQAAPRPAQSANRLRVGPAGGREQQNLRVSKPLTNLKI